MFGDQQCVLSGNEILEKLEINYLHARLVLLVTNAESSDIFTA